MLMNQLILDDYRLKFTTQETQVHCKRLRNTPRIKSKNSPLLVLFDPGIIPVELAHM